MNGCIDLKFYLGLRSIPDDLAWTRPNLVPLSPSPRAKTLGLGAGPWSGLPKPNHRLCLNPITFE